MNSIILGYIERDSLIHRISGAAKMMAFVFWSAASAITFDTRVLALMAVLGCIFFAVSQIRLREIAIVLSLILAILVINNLAIFFFSPYQGVEIYGSRHDVVHLFWRYTLTLEQLFYQLNVTLKYFTIIPIAVLFIVTTQPSEFASSLNAVGVNYKIASAVGLTLRYIPDLQREYMNIAISQQARGIDLSKNEKFKKRVTNALSIVIPLIFSSLERIDTVSNAMELRRFGEKKKRTWYAKKPFKGRDFLTIGLTASLLALSILSVIINGQRFYNPFLTQAGFVTFLF